MGFEPRIPTLQALQPTIGPWLLMVITIFDLIYFVSFGLRIRNLALPFQKKTNSIGATVQKLFTVEGAFFAFIRVSMENVYFMRFSDKSMYISLDTIDYR